MDQDTHECWRCNRATLLLDSKTFYGIRLHEMKYQLGKDKWKWESQPERGEEGEEELHVFKAPHLPSIGAAFLCHVLLPLDRSGQFQSLMTHQKLCFCNTRFRNRSFVFPINIGLL